jgi:hypothetical protein
LDGNVRCFVSGLNEANESFLISHNYASNVILDGSLIIRNGRNSFFNNGKYLADIYMHIVGGIAENINLQLNRSFICIYWTD